MLVLGLLLVAGAALITIGAFFDAGETATVEVLGQTLTTTAAGVFVIGAFTMLMFLLGVWALMASMSRSRRKRVERKQARAQHRDSVRSLEEERASLREENERLNRQLADRERTGVAAGTAGAATAGSTHDRDHDGVDDRAEGQSTHRGFMDRVTGRHHETTDTSTDTSTDTTSTVDNGYRSDTTTSGDNGYRSEGSGDDRVIDQSTDLRSSESTTSGHRRDV